MASLAYILSSKFTHPRGFDNQRFTKNWSFGLKGIMALVILTHHVSTHWTEWYNQPHISRQIEEWIGNPIVWERIVLSDFHIWGEIIVGMFFFVSGYGMMVSFMKRGDDYIKSFPKKRFVKLLPEFLILGITNQFLISYRTGDLDIVGRFIDFVVYGKFFFLWFITMLIWFYLAFYFSFKYIKNINKAMASVLLIVVLLSMYVGLRGYGEWWWKSNLCLPLGIYYAFYERHISRWLGKDMKKKLVYFLSAFLFLTVITRISNHFQTSKMLTLMFPIFIVWMSYLLKSKSNKITDFLSNISYEIFLVHVMYLDFIPLMGNFSPIMSVIVLMALTIPTAYVCHIVFKGLKLV